jgi:hypothetical protein
MFLNEFFNKKTVEAETQPNTGTRTVSSSAGTTTYDAAGKATQHATPRLGGMQKTTDLQTRRTTTSVDGAGISASQSTGGGITDVTSATMDLGSGTASVHQGVGFGGAGKDVQGPYQGSITNTATGATTNVVGRLPTRQDMGVEEDSTQDRLHRRHQELRKKSGLPNPDYYKELKAAYDIEDDAKRIAAQAEIKKKYRVAEAGPFSYGAKKPRKGSVADLAAKKRKEQEKNKKPIEPKDQMVGTAKVVTNEDIESYIEEMRRAGYEIVTEAATLCPECGGTAYADQLLAEKQDACYSKVKSRYKVWPSAYASGALVRCRKVGAKNWGNKSKK